MYNFDPLEVWFVTGSQHLYGEAVLKTVEDHAREISTHLGHTDQVPVTIRFKYVATNPDIILQLAREANSDRSCIGLILWMHTFSPAKMWIAGLKALQKPFLHLHTQFNRDIPWSEIDMDFMNLNQSAHGDREFGFMVSRLGRERKVITGHWKDPEVHLELGAWIRAAAAWHDQQGAKIARFGDNMREVAVTEGDKVSAQVQFGYSVNGYGLGDLVSVVNEVEEKHVNELIEIYRNEYVFPDDYSSNQKLQDSVKAAARIEAGLRIFLKNGNFAGYTNTFENLHGLAQLPGIASQRLMAEGYGFGAEGDWKTAALVRAMKVMGSGKKGGTSFMEDYTYHFDPAGMQVLGAHMLEICPSIARDKPKLEVHPLSIGGKADPVRLVFDTAAGNGLNATLVDLGHRFRMIVNLVEATESKPLPKLPVARVLWKPLPDLKTAATAWIYAGGAHHTGFSQAVTLEELENFAGMAGIEFLVIDQDTRIRQFRDQLSWNEVYYQFKK